MPPCVFGDIICSHGEWILNVMSKCTVSIGSLHVNQRARASPLRWNKCTFACEGKGTWGNRVRKLNGDRRQSRKTCQQVWGVFENVLLLWHWHEREAHNTNAATLLVIREVSCGRTLQKRSQKTFYSTVKFQNTYAFTIQQALDIDL